MSKSLKRPCFSRASARRAQRLAVLARRANDQRLRAELVDRLPAMSRTLRAGLVAAIGQRAVDHAVISDRQERGQ